jgi:folate-binding protein YgfZ
VNEYAAAREGAAIVELADRSILVVTGPQRQKFLHGLLSNDVANLVPGQGRKAALMDVKGHLIAFLRVLVSADAIWLETTSSRIAIVEATLQHYRVAAPVRFQAAATRVLALLGPQAGAVLGRAASAVPALDPDAHVEAAIAGQPVRVARASDLPGEGVTLYAEPQALATIFETLRAAGAEAITSPTLDILRVENGRPWYGSDITEENLLHETGLLAEYHSPTKGCYVGQEVVARLEGRGGNVNKQLRGLQLSAPAAAGAGATVDGQTVGRVTTAVLSPRFGPIALAYIHRAHLEPGTRVAVDGAPAQVVALPFVQVFQP